MKGFSTGTAPWKQGLYLGVLPEQAAARDSSTPLVLDHDLEVLPEAGRRMTVARLATHIADLANRLWAAGVRPGEKVAIYKTANFDAWMLGTAVARVGAVPVMLQPALDGATVGILLGRLHQPHLLTDLRKLEAMADVPVADVAKQVIIVAGSAPGTVSLADFVGAPRVEPVFQGIDDAAMITHTSGTTGVPKLVVHTPRTMGVRLRPQWWLLSLMRRRDPVAINLPFVHSRTFAAMALVLLKAMPVLLVKAGDSAGVAEVFLEHRPGFIEALPNALMEWEELADDPRRPFASVKYFSSTFDAIHPRTISRLLHSSDRRGALFFQIYGQSEVGPAVGRPYFRKSAHKTDGRCVGWAMPLNAKIRVVSRNGKRPSKENPGFIEARWDGIAKTYFGEQDRYDANVNNGWWRTGDVGYRTKRGCLHMLDREIDMIPTLGSNLELEDVLLNRLEELTELVVVAGPNSEPIPVICTSKDAPLDLERWRAAVTDYPQLADPIQIPEAELPRTATLKVQRVKLTERLLAEMQKQG